VKTFKIVTNTVPEKCLTVEFPDGKDYFFESGRHSVRFFENTNDISVFEYISESYIIKSIIAEVSHTPMIQTDLENGDILKFSWVDEDDVNFYVQLGNNYIDNSGIQYFGRSFRAHQGNFVFTRFENVFHSFGEHEAPLDDPSCIVVRDDCKIYTYPILCGWHFDKYKVKRVQAVPETRPDETFLDRQLDSE